MTVKYNAETNRNIQIAETVVKACDRALKTPRKITIDESARTVTIHPSDENADSEIKSLQLEAENYHRFYTQKLYAKENLKHGLLSIGVGIVVTIINLKYKINPYIYCATFAAVLSGIGEIRSGKKLLQPYKKPPNEDLAVFFKRKTSQLSLKAWESLSQIADGMWQSKGNPDWPISNVWTPSRTKRQP